MKNSFATLLLLSASFAYAQDTEKTLAMAERPNDPIEQSVNEKHFKNMQQLTFGGDNAEAYFSFDGKKLSFQSNNPVWGLKCDQIYYMIIDEAADNKIYQP